MEDEVAIVIIDIVDHYFKTYNPWVKNVIGDDILKFIRYKAKFRFNLTLSECVYVYCACANMALGDDKLSVLLAYKTKIISGQDGND